MWGFLHWVCVDCYQHYQILFIIIFFCLIIFETRQTRMEGGALGSWHEGKKGGLKTEHNAPISVIYSFNKPYCQAPLKRFLLCPGDQIFVQICTFFIFKLKPPLLPADSVGFYVPRVQIRKANGITYMGRRATDTTRSIAVKNNIYRPSIIFRPSNKRSGTGIISDAVILTQQLTCVPVSQASHCQI